MRISVVIPTFNSAEFVTRVVESILKRIYVGLLFGRTIGTKEDMQVTVDSEDIVDKFIL